MYELPSQQANKNTSNMLNRKKSRTAFEEICRAHTYIHTDQLYLPTRQAGNNDHRESRANQDYIVLQQSIYQCLSFFLYSSMQFPTQQFLIFRNIR